MQVSLFLSVLMLFGPDAHKQTRKIELPKLYARMILSSQGLGEHFALCHIGSSAFEFTIVNLKTGTLQTPNDGRIPKLPFFSISALDQNFLLLSPVTNYHRKIIFLSKEGQFEQSIPFDNIIGWDSHIEDPTFVSSGPGTYLLSYHHDDDPGHLLIGELDVKGKVFTLLQALPENQDYYSAVYRVGSQNFLVNSTTREVSHLDPKSYFPTHSILPAVDPVKAPSSFFNRKKKYSEIINYIYPGQIQNGLSMEVWNYYNSSGGVLAHPKKEYWSLHPETGKIDKSSSICLWKSGSSSLYHSISTGEFWLEVSGGPSDQN